MQVPLQHLSAAQARNVADLAEQVRTRFQGEQPASGDAAFAAMLEYRDSPKVQALNHAVESLSDAGRKELAALVWLGRGDFDDLASALDHAGQFPPEACYITGKTGKLSEFILAGLRRL